MVGTRLRRKERLTSLSALSTNAKPVVNAAKSVGHAVVNATVRDVARKAGVSAMTVSRVINGGEGVRPETRKRVEHAVTELDFVPNAVAPRLMSRTTRPLPLIFPDISTPF